MRCVLAGHLLLRRDPELGSQLENREELLATVIELLHHKCSGG